NGATAVAPNLAEVQVSAPESLLLPGTPGLWIFRPAKGPAVPSGDTESVPCTGAGACYRTAIAGPLLPATTYVLELAMAVTGETGRVFSPGAIGALTTGTESDTTPPRLLGASVEV